jgi:hypothetical protein
MISTLPNFANFIGHQYVIFNHNYPMMANAKSTHFQQPPQSIFQTQNNHTLSEKRLIVEPTINQNKLTLEVSAPYNSKCLIALYNTIGGMAHTQTIDLIADKLNVLEFDMTHMSTNFYQLAVVTKSEKYLQSFLYVK